MKEKKELMLMLVMELVMELEEEFEITIPDEEAEKLQSVGDVIKYVEENAE